jgi:hypothetical protein
VSPRVLILAGPKSDRAAKAEAKAQNLNQSLWM